VIKKRLAGVVTVKDGWAVQSFGYERYLPLGRPDVLVENLDRWGADEIFLQCIDRSVRSLGPDLRLLERVARKGLSTPLIYAGGIRTPQDAIAAVKTGADRVCVDALFHDDPQAVAALSEPLGAQALIAALPLAHTAAGLRWRDYRSGQQVPLNGSVLDVLRSGAISEALVIDWQHEGSAGAFDPRLLTAFPVAGIPLIAFGGISEAAQMHELLQLAPVSAVAIGNFLNYREHAVDYYRHQLTDLPIRPAGTNFAPTP
jgi:cyclase